LTPRGPRIPFAPLIGAAYVAALSIWAARASTGEAQDLGDSARQIEAVVFGRFGGEVGRIGVAVVGAAVVVGALLGLAADGLRRLREWLHGPRPGGVRRALHVFGLVAALEAAGELWAMAHDPQLYAMAWYARGGWRRTVEVLASDVLHPNGVLLLGVLGVALYLAGPRSSWPEWPRRVATLGRFLRARWARVMALSAAAMATGVLALVLGRLPEAHADVARDARHETRPNILVLAADSLRADRLEPRTAPNLSRLADRGTRFDRAYVSLPRTFPSWVSILTGRHPHHHGIRSMFPRWEDLARDFDALPEHFARAGFSTGVVSDYAGDIFSRIDLGFRSTNVPEFDFRQLVRQRALERETPLLPWLHTRLGRAAFPVLREMNDAADPQMLARDAVRAMRSLEGQGPFFLVVFFSTAHFPYAAPSPFYRRFTDPDYRGRYKYDKPVGLGRDAPADADDERQVRGLYDGAVLAVDDAAQTVLGALDRDGIAKDTLVVVTADHGETLYDHGHGQGHGDHLFGDEGTHVPLVVFDPRDGATHGPPRRVSSLVRDVDIAPTLYALAGVAPPPDLDGQSLVPALRDEPLPPALAYAETGLWFTEDIPGLPADWRLPYPGIARLTEVDTQHGDELVLQRAVRPLTLVAKHRMVRDDRYKLVYAPTRQGVRWALFDTVDDPGEERDVAASHPDVVARLQGALWTWMRQDPGMTERRGFLVPRDEAGTGASGADDALVRLGADPPP
jgi:arylsulfatase A-like enzyme